MENVGLEQIRSQSRSESRRRACVPEVRTTSSTCCGYVALRPRRLCVSATTNAGRTDEVSNEKGHSTSDDGRKHRGAHPETTSRSRSPPKATSTAHGHLRVCVRGLHGVTRSRSTRRRYPATQCRRNDLPAAFWTRDVTARALASRIMRFPHVSIGQHPIGCARCEGGLQQ
jgi:hypothetical protein